MGEWDIKKDHTKHNEEPVYYCSCCLSVAIRNLEDSEDTAYCDKCGSTEISEANIYEWETKYVEKYGKKFLD